MAISEQNLISVHSSDSAYAYKTMLSLWTVFYLAFQRATEKTTRNVIPPSVALLNVVEALDNMDYSDFQSG